MVLTKGVNHIRVSFLEIVLFPIEIYASECWNQQCAIFYRRQENGTVGIQWKLAYHWIAYITE